MVSVYDAENAISMLINNLLVCNLSNGDIVNVLILANNYVTII